MLPRPYRWLERRLEPFDTGLAVGLWIVIAITVFVLVQPSKSLKAAWLAWIIIP
jgi:hypothetical protein